MDVNIIVIGKIKENYINDGIKEYLKRLKSFANVKIIELKEYTYSDMSKNLKEEAKQIFSQIKEDDYLVTLEIEGKHYNSEEFSSFISNHYTYFSKPLFFLIGSSDGLSEEVRNRSNMKVSFSRMTFPHQLMRLIFIEQLYRAFTIINNQKYHK